MFLIYGNGPIPARFEAAVKRRGADREVGDVIATKDNIVDRLQSFVDVGASKFVIVPLDEPDDWQAELHQMAELVLPLEN